MVGTTGRGGSYMSDSRVSQQELVESSFDEFTERRPKRRRMSRTDANQCSKTEAESITGLLL